MWSMLTNIQYIRIELLELHNIISEEFRLCSENGKRKWSKIINRYAVNKHRFNEFKDKAKLFFFILQLLF